MADFTTYKLGSLPSSPPPGHFRVAVVTSQQSANLPPAFGFGYLPPVWDQGQEGSCVGHAGAAVMTFNALRAGIARTVSRRDFYEGAPPAVGGGADPVAAVRNAQTVGICTEPDWPYVALVAGVAGPNAVADRPLSRVTAYALVDTDPTSLKGAMVHQQTPLMLTIPVTDGFYNPDVNGVVTSSGQLRGYHEIACIGYDDAKQALRLRNSWGSGWGDSGHCWYPYSLTVTQAICLTVSITNPVPVKHWWAFLFPWWS